jgi:hypothetical protein
LEIISTVFRWHQFRLGAPPVERQNDRRGLRHDLYGRKSEHRAGDGGKEPRAFIANLVALVIEEAPNGKPQINTIRVVKPCSVTRREESDRQM